MSRATAIRAHWRNPSRIAEVKRKVREAMLLDEGAKGAACVAGISHSTACNWARVLGFRLMYVTDDERAELMAQRAQRKQRAEFAGREGVGA